MEHKMQFSNVFIKLPRVVTFLRKSSLSFFVILEYFIHTSLYMYIAKLLPNE